MKITWLVRCVTAASWGGTQVWITRVRKFLWILRISTSLLTIRLMANVWWLPVCCHRLKFMMMKRFSLCKSSVVVQNHMLIRTKFLRLSLTQSTPISCIAARGTKPSSSGIWGLEPRHIPSWARRLVVSRLTWIRTWGRSWQGVAPAEKVSRSGTCEICPTVQRRLTGERRLLVTPTIEHTTRSNSCLACQWSSQAAQMTSLPSASISRRAAP